MPKQLFVLGPAFNLPSIDAECISAAAILKLRYGNDPSEWSITPCHDLVRTLPYLVDNGATIHGLASIADHVSSEIKQRSSPQDQADAAASTSFINSQAPALLSTYLYVSSENYRTITRPAFTRILPLYARFLLPPSIRSTARKRTEHLGLGSLDVDTIHDQPSQGGQKLDAAESSFEADSKHRASLLLPKKQTVRSLLAQRPESTAVFKLQHLSDAFLGPLEDMLGKQEWLSKSEEPGIVDCIAYGYLSLMLYAPVPQDWLAERMRRKYKSLVAYVKRLHKVLNLETKLEDVTTLNASGKVQEQTRFSAERNLGLPWTPPRQEGLLHLLGSLLQSVPNHIPMMKAPAVIAAQSDQSHNWTPFLPGLIYSTLLAIAAGTYWAFQTGHLVWPHGDQAQIFGRKRVSDYGHVAAALSGLTLLGQQARRDQAYHGQEETSKHGALAVDVAIETEGGR